MADLNETSLEDALIDISGFTDDRGLTISVQASKMIVPSELVFVAERILNSQLRSGTSDNDLNAVRSTGYYLVVIQLIIILLTQMLSSS